MEKTQTAEPSAVPLCLQEKWPLSPGAWPPPPSHLQLGPGALPLGREDPVEQGVTPVLGAGAQREDILQHIEGEAVLRPQAQQLGLQEGRPALLQDPPATLVALGGGKRSWLPTQALRFQYNSRLQVVFL